jgi:hypothetical protein
MSDWDQLLQESEDLAFKVRRQLFIGPCTGGMRSCMHISHPSAGLMIERSFACRMQRASHRWTGTCCR